MEESNSLSGVEAISSLPAGELVQSDDLHVAIESTTASGRSVSSRPVGRDALIYGLGIVMSRAASFIMLPVYTRLLTTADYGLMQMLDVAVDVIGLLVSAGTLFGIMRFYFKAETDEQRRAVLSTAFTMQLCLNIIGSVLLSVLAYPVWKYGLGEAGRVWYVYVAAANFTVAGLLTVPMTYMQIARRAGLYTLTSLVKLILQLTLNVMFLVVMHKGPIGIFLSTLIASFVVGGASTIWLMRTNGFVLSRRAAKDLIGFGLPYQVATGGNFILTFGDRFFLQPTHGLAAVGIYSFAYQFGFVMSSLGIGPYSQAWTPRRYELLLLEKKERDRQYNIGLFYLSLISITTAVGIAVLVHPMLRIMSKPDYLDSANLVPVILAAYLIQGWGFEVQFGINVSEQTRYGTYAAWISVAAVLLCYSTLIPVLGGLGAAIATVVGFTVRSAATYYFSQRLWHVDYRWKSTAALLAAGSVVVGASYFARVASLALEIGLAFGLIAIFGITAWTLVLNADRRSEITEFSRSKIHAVAARIGLA